MADSEDIEAQREDDAGGDDGGGQDTPEFDGASEKEGNRVKAVLTWKDLKLTLNGKRYILQGLSGCAEPGHLTAIMGPSGSGKSTLLETLSGRASREANVTGNILVNGHKANLSYGSAAFLAQEVSLLGTLTVYETLYFSAKLRFKDSTSESETRRLVMCAIEEVGLVDALDTRIGTWYNRGLSGGEKRRVSIAIELLTSPTLIFLDEPTSGLDSASSFHVVKTLKRLAETGDRTILCSIHQPSSEVFELFDDLCLLSDGQQVYFGPLPQALQLFERSGYPCPRLRSPSDHFVHCVNSDFDSVDRILTKQESVTVSGRRVSSVSDRPVRKTTTQTVAALLQGYEASDEKKSLDTRIDTMSQTTGGFFEDKGSHASIFKQTFYLTIRSGLNMYRDIGYFWLRLFMYIILCICIGTIFNDVGHGFSSFMARASCFIFIVSFLCFMAVGGFPSFIEDMKVFHMERKNGHYKVASFVIANTLSSMPFIFVITGISTAIVYPLVVFRGGFVTVLYFFLTLYGCLLVAEAMMMAVTSVVSQFLLGILLGAGLQGIFILVSGFFRYADDLPHPVWKYPLYYLSYITYAFQGLVQNEMIGQTFDPIIPGAPPISGHFVAAVIFQLKVGRSKWWSLAIIYGMFLVYRIIFWILLSGRETFFPTISSLIFRNWGHLRAKIPQLKLSSRLSKSSADTQESPDTIVLH